MDRPALHVIFGAGQVGRPLAERLLAGGSRVRVVRRSDGGVPNGADVARGDTMDPGFCREAAGGATTVYHCMNPPYSAKVRARVIPALMNNLIGAAGAAGARLVVLSNLYALGRPNGRPLHEETILEPCSRKGEIQARAARRLLEAYALGEARGLLAQASDFYGPGATQTHLGDEFWPGVLAGGKGRLVVNPDTTHTYHYIPDVVAGLAALGTTPDADVEGQPWMLPCAHAEPTRALIDRFAAHIDRPIELSVLSPRAMRLMGVVVPIMRELAEMSYQWEEPFVVDDRRFRARFPDLRPTDRDEAAAATVAWARAHYTP